MKGDLEIVSSNPEFDPLEDRLSRLEPIIQFSLKNSALAEFTDNYNCMVELLDYRNELLGEIRDKIEDQKYVLGAGDRLKKFETSRISKSNTKDYHDLLEIKRKTEALAQDLSLPNYCAYFSRDEVRELKGSMEQISRIVAYNERSSSKDKIEKAYEAFASTTTNTSKSMSDKKGKGKNHFVFIDGPSVIPITDIGTTVQGIGEGMKAGAEGIKTVAEAQTIFIENSEKSRIHKEKKRLDKIISDRYRQKIAHRIDDLCESFTKEAEKNGAIADSEKAEIFIRRISKANPFWSKNNQNWIKVVDYIREVHKGTSALSLKDFVISESQNFDFKNIELLLPTLFLNVSQPKLELPKKPDPTPFKTEK
ncbi:MAG: hypothetical protein ABIQ95_03855 [Bdellovibrionia bacterium]